MSVEMSWNILLCHRWCHENDIDNMFHTYIISVTTGDIPLFLVSHFQMDFWTYGISCILCAYRCPYSALKCTCSWCLGLMVWEISQAKCASKTFQIICHVEDHESSSTLTKLWSTSFPAPGNIPFMWQFHLSPVLIPGVVKAADKYTL